MAGGKGRHSGPVIREETCQMERRTPRGPSPRLHRWSNSSPDHSLPIEPQLSRHSLKRWKSLPVCDKAQQNPKKPIRSPETSSSSHKRTLPRIHIWGGAGSPSAKNNATTTSPPRAPTRTIDGPVFLSPRAAPCSPRRKPPKRSEGFREADAVDIPNIRLEPISFVGDNGSSTNQVQTGMVRVLQNVLLPESSLRLEHNDDTTHNDVTVVFAIRRPGCGLCREHGIQLSELVDTMENVNAIGVVKKEIEVNNHALMEFYSDYFSFPLYKDEKWDLFHTLGSKQVTIWNMILAAPKLFSRYGNKKIRNIPFGGDLFTKGGVLIFDKHATLRFVYYERYGDGLDLEALRWAIGDARFPLESSSDTSINS